MTQVILLGGVAPCLLAALLVSTSAYSVWRTSKAVQILASLMTGGAVAWALLMLNNMIVLNAWPTGLPYVLLLAVVPVAAIQLAATKSSSTRMGPQRADRVLFAAGVTVAVLPAMTLMAVIVTTSIVRVEANEEYEVTDAVDKAASAPAGAPRAWIQSANVTLLDGQPFEVGSNNRITETVQTFIAGRDYSVPWPVIVRLGFIDANRYWEFVRLLKIRDRSSGLTKLAVAQRNGPAFRSLMTNDKGQVSEDRFTVDTACADPLRTRLVRELALLPTRPCPQAWDAWPAVVRPWDRTFRFEFLGFGLIAAASLRRRREPVS